MCPSSVAGEVLNFFAGTDSTLRLGRFGGTPRRKSGGRQISEGQYSQIVVEFKMPQNVVVTQFCSRRFRVTEAHQRQPDPEEFIA
jgi:hypothetical protein